MLVLNRKGEVFLGERLGEPGAWQFPQGGVVTGLTLEENVIKELNEELGAPAHRFRIIKKLNATHDYEFIRPPDYAKDKWRGQSQSFWLVAFEGDDGEIDLNRSGEPEFMSWCWCPPEAVLQRVQEIRVEGYRKPLAELKEYRAGS